MQVNLPRVSIGGTRLRQRRKFNEDKASTLFTMRLNHLIIFDLKYCSQVVSTIRRMQQVVQVGFCAFICLRRKHFGYINTGRGFMLVLPSLSAQVGFPDLKLNDSFCIDGEILAQ